MENHLLSISNYIRNLNEIYSQLSEKNYPSLETCFKCHLTVIEKSSQFLGVLERLKTEMNDLLENAKTQKTDLKTITDCLTELSQLESYEFPSQPYDYKNPKDMDLFSLLVPLDVENLNSGEIVRLIKIESQFDYLVETTENKKIKIPWIYLKINKNLSEYSISLKRQLIDLRNEIAFNNKMYKSTGYFSIKSKNRLFVAKSFIWNDVVTADNSKPQIFRSSLTERNTQDVERSLQRFRESFTIQILINSTWVDIDRGILNKEIDLIGEDLFIIKHPWNPINRRSYLEGSSLLCTTAELTKLGMLRVGILSEPQKNHFEVKISPNAEIQFCEIKQAFENNLLFWEGSDLFINSGDPKIPFKDCFTRILLKILPFNQKISQMTRDPRGFNIFIDSLIFVNEDCVCSVQEAYAYKRISFENLQEYLTTFITTVGSDMRYHKGWGSLCSLNFLNTLSFDQTRWITGTLVPDDLVTQSLALSMLRPIIDQTLFTEKTNSVTVKEALMNISINMTHFTIQHDPGRSRPLIESFGLKEDQWEKQTLNLFMELISMAFFSKDIERKSTVSPWGIYCWNPENLEMATFAYFARLNGYELKQGNMDIKILTKLIDKFGLSLAKRPCFICTKDLLNSDKIECLVLFKYKELLPISNKSIFFNKFLNFVGNCRLFCDYNSKVVYYCQNNEGIFTFLNTFLSKIIEELTLENIVALQDLLEINKQQVEPKINELTEFARSIYYSVGLPDKIFGSFSDTIKNLKEIKEAIEYTEQSCSKFNLYIEEHEERALSIQNDVKLMESKPDCSLGELKIIGQKLNFIIEEYNNEYNEFKNNLKSISKWGGCMDNVFDHSTMSSFEMMLRRYQTLTEYLDEIIQKKLSEKECLTVGPHVANLDEVKSRLLKQRDHVIKLSKEVDACDNVDSILMEIKHVRKIVSEELKNLDNLRVKLEDLAKMEMEIDLKDLFNRLYTELTSGRALLDFVEDLMRMTQTKKETEIKNHQKIKPLEELIDSTKKYLMSENNLLKKLNYLKENQIKYNKIIFENKIINEDLFNKWKILKESNINKIKLQVFSDMSNLLNWFSRVKLENSQDSLEEQIKYYFDIERKVNDKISDSNDIILIFEEGLFIETMKNGNFIILRNKLIFCAITTINLLVKRNLKLKVMLILNNKLAVNFPSIAQCGNFNDFFDVCKSIDAQAIELFVDVECDLDLLKKQKDINNNLKVLLSEAQSKYEDLTLKFGKNSPSQLILDGLIKDCNNRESEIEDMFGQVEPLWEIYKTGLQWIEDKTNSLKELVAGQISHVNINNYINIQNNISDKFENLKPELTQVASKLTEICKTGQLFSECSTFCQLMVDQFQILLDYSKTHINLLNSRIKKLSQLDNSLHEKMRNFAQKIKNIDRNSLFSQNFGILENFAISISAEFYVYERFLEDVLCLSEEDLQFRYEEAVCEWADLSRQFTELKNLFLSTNGVCELALSRLRHVGYVGDINKCSQPTCLKNSINENSTVNSCTQPTCESNQQTDDYLNSHKMNYEDNTCFDDTEVWTERETVIRKSCRVDENLIPNIHCGTTNDIEGLYYAYYWTKEHVDVLYDDIKCESHNCKLNDYYYVILAKNNQIYQQIVTSTNLNKLIKTGLINNGDCSPYDEKLKSFVKWLSHVEGLLEKDSESVAKEICEQAVSRIEEVKEILRLYAQVGLEAIYCESPRGVFSRWRTLVALGFTDENDQLVKELADFMREIEENISNCDRNDKSYQNYTFLGDLLVQVERKESIFKTDLSSQDYGKMIKKLSELKVIIRKRLTEIDSTTLTHGNNEVIDSLINWLIDAEKFLLSTNDSLFGDINTVKMLVEQYQGMAKQVETKEVTIREMEDDSPESSISYKQVVSIYERVDTLMTAREANLEKALELAEELKNGVEYAKEVIQVAEQVLRVKPTYNDNEQLLCAIHNHENFLECLADEEKKIDYLKEITETIMSGIHPNAVRFVRYDYTISCASWEQIVQKAQQRTEKLNRDFNKAKKDTMEMEELTNWLVDAKGFLSEKTKFELPRDLSTLNQLLKEHEEFHDELNSKYGNMNEIFERSFSSLPNESTGSTPKIYSLWKSVRKSSTEYLFSLQRAIDECGRYENIDHVDFQSWRTRYLSWLKEKKLRILDFYRKNDSKEEGRIARERFVVGLTKAGFASSRGELNAIFSLFGGSSCDDLEYKIIVDAILHGKTTRNVKLQMDQVLGKEALESGIAEEIAKCVCSRRVEYRNISEGKYKIGSAVKYLKVTNGQVVVRVGGGWQLLSDYMEAVDPCRVKKSTEHLRSFKNLHGIPRIGRSMSSISISNLSGATRNSDKRENSYLSVFARRFSKKN